VYPTAQLLRGVARVSIKNEIIRENNYGNCIAASRPDRITPGTLWIGGSNDKNIVYPTAKILPDVARVSIKNEGNLEINIGNCISASRPDRLTPGTLWIGGSNYKNVVYPTAKLLHGVARVSINMKEFE
jgi:multisubunit Na+/H+ antiporter MnhE subunit